MSAVYQAFRMARKAGWVTRVLNPAPFPKNGLPKGVLRLTTLLTPNESEFRALLKARDRERVRKVRIFSILRQINPQHIAVTHGARGVFFHMLVRDISRYYSIRNPKRAEAAYRAAKTRLVTTRFTPPRVKPVDTVGAGDCFNGALAAWLAEHDLDYCDAIRFAVAAAALKVTRHGAQAGMPRRAEILRMLKKMGRAPKRATA